MPHLAEKFFWGDTLLMKLKLKLFWQSCKFVLNIFCNFYLLKVWRYLQTYSSNFPFERKFFWLFPFEQANIPGSNVEKLTGRVIRRARQTRGKWKKESGRSFNLYTSLDLNWTRKGWQDEEADEGRGDRRGVHFQATSDRSWSAPICPEICK